MENVNLDSVAHVVIKHFLSSLMRIERERLGYTRKAASKEAGMSSSAWAELERGARNIGPQHWMGAADVLNLLPEDVVRRLNAFVGKYPSIWLERTPGKTYKICDRSTTSPRALRSGKVINVDLNQMRPGLYYDLSSFSKYPEKIVGYANKLGFFAARKATTHSHGDSFTPVEAGGRPARQEKLTKSIGDLSDEKFGLMERVVDKFERCTSKELAIAYQHFSLSVSKH